eukprot:scaffold1896_cov121-Isochrysis_galbana.AAC.10
MPSARTSLIAAGLARRACTTTCNTTKPRRAHASMADACGKSPPGEPMVAPTSLTLIHHSQRLGIGANIRIRRQRERRRTVAEPVRPSRPPVLRLLPCLPTERCGAVRPRAEGARTVGTQVSRTPELSGGCLPPVRALLMPRPETPRTDTPRTDTPRTDTPRTDTPRTGTPRTDAPRTDTPRPRTEAP